MIWFIWYCTMNGAKKYMTWTKIEDSFISDITTALTIRILQRKDSFAGHWIQMECTQNSDCLRFAHQYFDNETKFNLVDVIILNKWYETLLKRILGTLPVILIFYLRTIGNIPSILFTISAKAEKTWRRFNWAPCKY